MQEYLDVFQLQLVCSVLTGGLTWLLAVGAGLAWRRCKYRGSTGYTDNDVETDWRSVIGYVGGGALIALSIIHLVPDTLERYALHGNSGPILVLTAFLFSYVITHGGLGSFGETVEEEQPPTLAGFRSFEETHGGVRSVSQYNSMDSDLGVRSVSQYNSMDSDLGNVSPQPQQLTDDNGSKTGILKDSPPSYGATARIGDNPPSYSAAVMPEGTDGGSVAESLSDSSPRRMWLLLGVMFLHCLTQGTLLGSLSDKDVIMDMATRLIIHKSIISFFVGVKIFSTIEKVLTAIVISTIFACSTPAGVAISVIFKVGAPSAFRNFVCGFTSGVVLHIGVSEGGMEGGLAGKTPDWRRQAGVVAGAGIIVMCAILVPPYQS